MNTNYVQLDRKFRLLPKDFTELAEHDQLDIYKALDIKVIEDESWTSLLENYRTIILSEAGTGKTAEIREACRRLRAERKHAFFLRIEHIVDHFDLAFEKGDKDEFDQWIHSGEEGYLFLDSVDESKLKNIKDFELAIKKISREIESAKDRTHIYITSRINFWRPKSDLELCTRLLCIIDDANDNLSEQPSAENLDCELLDNDENELEQEVTEISSVDITKFKVYALTDLTDEMVELFIHEKNVNDPAKFLEELERRDAQEHARRPQDLEELIIYWNENEHLGERYELIKASIDRRLREWDTDRAFNETLTQQKVYDGAKLLAAACTLLHESTIIVSDTLNEHPGIDVNLILPNWTEPEIKIFLGRPIFDEAIYGTVRFHHRSVREFLTAEWLNDSLQRQGSRRNVENLFFRMLYGREVIVPYMRPILNWMVLFDEKIRERAIRLQPEIILECSDPSKLPLPARKSVLKQVCHNLYTDETRRSELNYSTVQHFASKELHEEISELSRLYGEDPDIRYLLMRMVWKGLISENLSDAKIFALDPSIDTYSRIAAIQAVFAIGSETDQSDILSSLANQSENVPRRLLAEVINILQFDERKIDWLFQIIQHLEEYEEYSADGLGSALTKLVSSLNEDSLALYVRHTEKLLTQPPVIEKRYCEVSEQFHWLIGSSIQVITRLIGIKHPETLNDAALSILILTPTAKVYSHHEFKYDRDHLITQLKSWRELNHALFWKQVEKNREWLDHKKNERLTDSWQIWYDRLWSFDAEDFDSINSEIKNQDFLDNKLVALTLAFQIYIEHSRPRKWRETLKKTAAPYPEVSAELKKRLHPPRMSDEDKKRKRNYAQHDKRMKQREIDRQEAKAKFNQWLRSNFELLRDQEKSKEGKLLNVHLTLLRKLQKLQDKSEFSWGLSDWPSLSAEFGSDVAEAFRDGAMFFWRYHKPMFQHENKEYDKAIYYYDQFGLTGIAIEATNTPNWINAISKNDVELLCRYAFKELNNFPFWFDDLYAKYPNEVKMLILAEVEWELSNTDVDYYLLAKIKLADKLIRDSSSVDLFEYLEREIENLKKLVALLEIIQSSESICDEIIADLAARKCTQNNSKLHLSHWFAVWVGVDPQSAINALSNYVASIDDTDHQNSFVMQFAENLIGERSRDSFVRNNYHVPMHLKDLYLFLYQYIRIEDDIQRAGTGVYSPGLRDNAQRARENIFSMLCEIPGKEAHQALKELSETDALESSKSWIRSHANRRVSVDADHIPLTTEQFNEFRYQIEFTPTNHHQLFELAKSRILDLKDDLEQGDSSNATLLQQIEKEVEIRKYISNWCRDKSAGKYSIPPEEELADGRRIDLRFHSSTFDAPVPVELKLADNWSGNELFERLENQLCGDYLRDHRSKCGIYLLVYRGQRTYWRIPPDNGNVNFHELTSALWQKAQELVDQCPHIDAISVIAINLTLRNT